MGRGMLEKVVGSPLLWEGLFLGLSDFNTQMLPPPKMFLAVLCPHVTQLLRNFDGLLTHKIKYQLILALEVFLM